MGEQLQIVSQCKYGYDNGSIMNIRELLLQNFMDCNLGLKEKT